VAALLLCLGCGQVRSGPDEAVVLIENTVRDLDPRFATSAYDNKLSRLIAPGLTTVDTPDSVPRLLLAESIEREGPGRYRVRLRSDARLPDGTPLDADDVVYTFVSAVDPELHTAFGKNLADKGFSARTVRALDARTVLFDLPRPLATFRSDIEFGLVSRRAALAAARGGRFPGGTVVGAGPFRIVRLSPERVELARNPYWLGGAPRLSRLVFQAVRDDGARILSLVGGSADLLQNSAAPSPLLLDAVLADPHLAASFGRSATWTYLGINCDDPLLRDVRVRQAVALALDRQALVAAKFHGQAVLSTSMLPPGNWAFAPDIKAWPHDPAAARALLAQAGALGTHVTLKTSAASKFRLAIARVLAAELDEAGFDAEVRAYEFATFLGDVKRGNFQLFLLQVAEVTEPDFLYAFFHSSRIPTRDNLDAGANRWRYRDPELDRLLERGRTEESPEARRPLYAEAQRRLAQALPAVPLWHEDNVAVTRRGLLGYRLWPNARFSSLAQAWKDGTALR
jgi:peptide/nickel transport system substrate-binding protein